MQALDGSFEEAILLQEQAIRISPRDPLISAFYSRIGIAHLLQSRTEKAIPWLEKGRNANPGFPGNYAWLASAYALMGDTERAATELAEARRLNRDERFTSIARLKAVGVFGALKTQLRALFEATYLRGLRLAGMPEE
jgi:tetratricopeptide (TPR) repeat protein